MTKQTAGQADAWVRAHRGGMARVRIYVKPNCPYSQRARMILERKGIQYDEVDISVRPAFRDEMVRLSGRTSTPQVFLDGRHLGGADELQLLASDGSLDAIGLADGSGAAHA